MIPNINDLVSKVIEQNNTPSRATLKTSTQGLHSTSYVLLVSTSVYLFLRYKSSLTRMDYRTYTLYIGAYAVTRMDGWTDFDDRIAATRTGNFQTGYTIEHDCPYYGKPDHSHLAKMYERVRPDVERYAASQPLLLPIIENPMVLDDHQSKRIGVIGTGGSGVEAARTYYQTRPFSSPPIVHELDDHAVDALKLRMKFEFGIAPDPIPDDFFNIGTTWKELSGGLKHIDLIIKPDFSKVPKDFYPQNEEE